MNQFLTPVFSPEKWKMKSLINQSLTKFNAVKCKETLSNVAKSKRTVIEIFKLRSVIKDAVGGKNQ